MIHRKCGKYSNHFSFEKGGKKPTNNSHVVIDRPESVNLVKPPTNIIKETKTNNDSIHNLS